MEGGPGRKRAAGKGGSRRKQQEAIEVELGGVLVERGRGSKRKQQEAIEVKVWKGS